MWAEKNVSLVEFYKTALASARNSGYLYIACIVARYAEYEKGFDYLEKHWSSFHDLSGKQILILVAGENIRKTLNSERLIKISDGEGACLASSDGIISGNLEIFRVKGNHYVEQLQKGMINGGISKTAHTNQTRELMEYFGITESQLPTLCLTSVVTGTTSIYTIDDTIEDEFYKALKHIKTKLEISLSILTELGNDLNKSERKLSRLKIEYHNYSSCTRLMSAEFGQFEGA